MIITIDGPAGSGKSTVADILAEKLGFIHFNSGSLYRGITAYLHEIGFNIESMNSETEIPSLDLKVRMIEDVQHVYVNGIDYTPQLRNNTISTLVAFIGANKFCRQIIDNCQRDFCSKNNVVMEGRDITTVVFPDANYKFYLDASVESRALRRFKENQEKGINSNLEEVKKNLEQRDYVDINVSKALVKVEDAIEVDTTNMTIEQVVAHISNKVRKGEGK